jgi:carbohydrate diacid regulator
MSPYLLDSIYQNIKQVIGRPIALTDRVGLVFPAANDFPKRKNYHFSEQPSVDKRTIAVEGVTNLIAVPIYVDGSFYGVVVTEGEDEIGIASIIQSLAELIVHQFLATHRPRPDAIDLLLTRVAYKPTTIDGEEFEQQLAASGYRSDVPRVVLAVELRGFWENYLQTAGAPLGEKSDLIAGKKRDIEHGLNSFFSRSQDNLVGYLGGDIFLVIKDLGETDYDKFCELLQKHFSAITQPLTNVYIREVTIGVGTTARTATALLRSVQEALQILKIGRRMLGGGQAHRFEGLGVLPLLLSGSDEQKNTYATHLFDKLDDPELVETLEAFLRANLNLTQTADDLSVHRNTVIYRLDKITDLLGRDPRQFEDAVELYIGNLFRKVFGRETP